MVANAEPGRRERKRRDTDDAISRAAIELALEFGYEAVTVEQICERADVSRSTFFNYFPSKDAAIIGRYLSKIPDGLADAVLAAHTDELVAGAFVLTVRALGGVEESQDIKNSRMRLFETSSTAVRQLSFALLGAQITLTVAVYGWLARHPEVARLPGRVSDEATLIVTAAYAAMHSMTGGWRLSLAEGGRPAFDLALDRLRRILDARRPGSPDIAKLASVPPAERGRRDRKRRETESRIELSAATLALELGFEKVTVDAICERADVSRSTFFNYFPSRDAAILGRPIDVLTGEAADAVLAAQAENLPRGIFDLIFASIGHTAIDSDVARARVRLSAEQPLARLAGTAVLTDAGIALMATAREWLEANPSDARIPEDAEAEASLSSNATYAAMSMMAGGWLEASGDLTASAVGYEAALSDLRTVLG